MAEPRTVEGESARAVSAELDFHDFHRTELPRRLADGNGALAAAALRRAKPIAFRVADGEARTKNSLPRSHRRAPGNPRILSSGRL